MDFVPIVHAAVTWALVGLIWVVQIVHYPLLGRVGAEAFAAYHASHMHRITPVVGPLMLAEAATAIWLVVHPPTGTCAPLPWVALALLLAAWLSTAFVQVPLHRRLERGFEAPACRALVRTNWIRTAAWTLRGILVAVWLLL